MTTQMRDAFCAATQPGHRRTSHHSAADWLSTQTQIVGLWLDQLVAEGDPDDLASLLHRHAAWLELMRSRIAQ